MEVIGLILFLMLPAMALMMLRFGIGVFGHPSLYHHHIAYSKKSPFLRHPLEALSLFILVIGFLLLVGVVELPTSNTQS